MCGWCDASEYTSTYYGAANYDMDKEIADGGYVYLCMLWNSDTNRFGMYASGEGEAVVDINYCPKCGREL